MVDDGRLEDDGVERRRSGERRWISDGLGSRLLSIPLSSLRLVPDDATDFHLSGLSNLSIIIYLGPQRLVPPQGLVLSDPGHAILLS